MGVQHVYTEPNSGGYAYAQQYPPASQGNVYAPAPVNNPRKRKAATAPHRSVAVVDLTDDASPIKSCLKQDVPTDVDEDDGKPKKKAKNSKDEEKRLRRFRKHPPSTYLEVRDRALTQRMFVLDRERNSDNPGHPIETISLAGSTGNVYTIIVDKVPSCNCPHAKKGNQCKHIAYILSRVLRVPAHLEYQLAFISSELREFFEKAPPLPSEAAEGEAKDGNRKSLEGECPICVCDFEPESGEAIVYCKAACGNNIHKACFEQWAATQRGQKVTCPFCRTAWEGDEESIKNVAKTGRVNEEGYVNVADQLGLSGRRDYGSYHAYWVRRQAENAAIAWDDDGVMEHEYGGRW
ncbi:Ring finger domain [Teratosphaeria destructans]|uniref:Ring finger domain n=1 Tax=Teratosphaeria destructans TaxID=418781 RepID=A0A9W7SKM4_9PEZI|nr:Ring finger domain [Teratosphaeria destructans]